jgi:two-component system sensor histidine kinase CreC
MLGFLPVVIAGFYYLTNWVLDELRPHYLKSMEESLVDSSVLLASLISTTVKNDSIYIDDLRIAFDNAYRKTFSAKIYDLVKKTINIRVYVTDTAGLVLFDSDHGRDEGKDYSAWNDVNLTLKGKYGARASHLGEEETSTLYVASPIVVDSNIVGVVSIGKPTLSVNFFILQAQQKITSAAIFVGLAVIVILGIFSVWVTSPIRKLTDYARAVRDGSNVRLPKLGKSEIGVMGSAFEEMRESLEGKNYVEQYVQTLTHEIKSPLSAIRGAAELMEEDMPVATRKQFTENIRIESDRIQRIVDQLLQLSALESRKMLKNVEPFDIVKSIGEVLEDFKTVINTKCLQIVQTLPKECEILGERFLFRQAVANLVQNSIEFTPENGKIILAMERLKDTVSIVIDDSGSGIPEYAMTKIFDRFYSLPRPQNKRKSTGLGLSLVKEIAILHGGSIVIENRIDCGVRAVLTMPVGGKFV